MFSLHSIFHREASRFTTSQITGDSFYALRQETEKNRTERIESKAWDGDSKETASLDALHWSEILSSETQVRQLMAYLLLREKIRLSPFLPITMNWHLLLSLLSFSFWLL